MEILKKNLDLFFGICTVVSLGISCYNHFNKQDFYIAGIICIIFAFIFVYFYGKNKGKKGVKKVIFKEIGIKNIYLKARGVDISNHISSAKKIYFIAYVGDTFTERHIHEYVTAFKNGASIHVLVGKKDSDFFKEIDQMENIPSGTGRPSLNPKVIAV